MKCMKIRILDEISLENFKNGFKETINLRYSNIPLTSQYPYTH